MFRFVNVQVALALIIMVLAVSPAMADNHDTGIFRSGDLKKYCKNAAPRQTIIYVDQSSVLPGDKKWAEQIINKVKLIPHERLTILKMDVQQGSVSELFSSCFPKFTAEEIESTKNQEGLISKLLGSSLDDVKKDRQLFLKARNFALSKIIIESKDQPKPVAQETKLPNKSIAEALFYDEKRFDLQNGIPRIIIYSDMMQSSPNISPSENELSRKKIKEKARAFPTGFNMAEVHVFGVGTTMKLGTSIQQKFEGFWRSYLEFNGAYLEQYSNNLTIPEQQIEEIDYWQGAIVLNDLHLETFIRFMTNKRGKLINSWLDIPQLGFIPISGKKSCNETYTKCSIEAELRIDVENLDKLPSDKESKPTYFFRTKDKLILQTASAKELKGELKPFDGACLTTVPEKVEEQKKKPEKLDDEKTGTVSESCRAAIYSVGLVLDDQ